MKKFTTILAVLALAVSMLFASCGENEKSSSVTVGTGGTTGTYYAFTNAVGSILQKDGDIKFEVVSTGGSVANINGIDDGDYDMAIVQNDTMINAYNDLDKDNFKNGAVKSFSVLGEVYSEVVQIVVDGKLKDKVKTLEDLKGMRVSVGDVGSGVYLNAKDLFAAYDIDIDKDITQNNLSVGDSADAMKDGKLDAFFFTAGAPTTAITELGTAMDIFILSLEDSVMDDFIENHKIDGKYEVYAKMPITKTQYNFIPEGETVYTIGVTATYIVASDLDEDTVYEMTKALWENTDAIAEAHAVGKGMNIDNALVTIGNVPVHPGAQRYYDEVK